MKTVVVLFALMLNIGCLSAQSTISQVIELDLQSERLNEKRRVLISLPEGYQESNYRYPVVYLLDGEQNLLHARGSADVLARTGNMPPVILVGIKSLNRVKDFTHSKVAERKNSGGGKQFQAFLVEELIPYIDAEYRTHPYRVLVGHSLSGLFAANLMMESESRFNGFIVISPALWWQQEEATQKARWYFDENRASNKEGDDSEGSLINKGNVKPTVAIENSAYFGIGALDGYGMRQELLRFVAEVEKSKSIRSKHEEFEGEGHMSAPLLVTYYGFKFLFADIQLPREQIDNFDSTAFLQHESSMLKKYGNAARQSQDVYVPLGLRLIQEGNFSGAIVVFKRNLEAYASNPFPPNYAWLADAHQHNKNYKEALHFFQKAYDLADKTGYGEKLRYAENIAKLEQLVKANE